MSACRLSWKWRPGAAASWAVRGSAGCAAPGLGHGGGGSAGGEAAPGDGGNQNSSSGPSRAAAGVANAGHQQQAASTTNTASSRGAQPHRRACTTKMDVQVSRSHQLCERGGLRTLSSGFGEMRAYFHRPA